MQPDAPNATPRLEYAEAVHAVARMIPAGKVLSYGDIAELLDAGGPRQVGKAMQASDAHIPWWRVIRADGSITQALLDAAREAWHTERTACRGGKVDMAAARWQPDEVAFARIEQMCRGLASGQPSDTDDGMEP